MGWKLVSKAWALAAACLAISAPASAGDRAVLNVLGYSTDQKYLAFEEFGEFDGSGGHYSHVFVVDLSNDSWVEGTPFSLGTSDDADTTTLAQVRAEVMNKAAPLLKKLGVEVPAVPLVLLGDGVANADGKSMVADQPSCCGPSDTDASVEVRLALKTFPAKATGQCAVDTAVGYSLTATFADGSTRELHKDGDTLPKSRSCPQDYRLYSVIEPFESEGGRVAIVSSYPFDFEGTSRRFIAVPIDAWQPDN